MDNAQSLASRPGRPTSRRRLHWIILAFVPSSLMLGFTTYLSTSIPPIPLLWVIPLSIYLLTFILVFATRPIIPHTLMVRVFPMILLPAVLIIIAQATQPIWLLVLFQLVTFFVVAMVCHGILAATRPAPAYLTEFYLWMSLGGVLGGAFNSLVAPVLFNSVLELPLVLSIACLLLPKTASVIDKRLSWWLDISLPAALGALTVGLIFTMQAAGLEQSQLRLALGFGIPAIICFSFSRRPLRFALAVGMLFLASSFYTVEEQGRLLYSDRSFFGIHRVFLDRSGQYHLLVHGATVHGKQSLDPSRRREPLTYYHPQGPIGQVFAALNSDVTKQRIAVVGLGAGSVACYSRPGQEWTFYEIDPVVERIARDPRLFSFLQECNPEAQIVLGDARLSLARAPDHFYDLIILDAYNSDSIPIHLMTREALALYRAKLAPGGIMAFHISNQYLDLHPVLSTLAQDDGLAYLIQNDTIFDHKLAMQGKDGSIWALVARSPADFGILSNDPRWVPLSGPPGTPVWTDNFSSIFSVLRWH
ncbi:MAG: hypothetical protein KatS3mg057_0984 [Herpetosiphonaceae bacterium]|nr:MAG: hypothetical protein KatS3mg057_0984 [Herpetosiphonaceae bacterium]